MADRGHGARRRLGYVALLAALAVGVAGCSSSGEGGDPDSSAVVEGVSTGDDHGFEGAYLSSPYVVPDVSLDDTDGASFSLAASDAPVKIVFFGYTKCPDICQIMMSTISSALTRLDAEEKKQVEVVFVTTDPARDTGPVLREYLDRFGTGYVGLTGSLPTIMRLGDPMKVYIAKGKKLPSGGYEVDHSTYVFGVTGADVRVIWTQGTSPAAMAADIIKLLKS